MERLNQNSIRLANVGMMPLSNSDLVDVYFQAKQLQLSEDFIRLVERALRQRKVKPVPVIYRKEDYSRKMD